MADFYKKVGQQIMAKSKLKTFTVNVNVTVSSSITVKAKNKEEATEKARKTYLKQWKDNSHHGLECPFVDVDFAEGDDVQEDGVDE
jgi:cell fate (sporulation/competence/biofilm development) regulator YmcA (YheA/YmcA/DUF963 family)